MATTKSTTKTREEDPELKRIKLVTPEEVCEILGISVSCLRQMRARGEFPEPMKINQKAVRWKLTDIEAWIESRQTVKLGGE